MPTPSNADLFLDLYKQVETIGRSVFFPKLPESENIIGRLMNLPQLEKHKEELNYCRVVRNFLTHNPRVGGAYPIEPSAQMVALLERILTSLENPPKAIDFAVRRKHMLVLHPHDLLVDVMRRMREKAFTHAPVVEKGKLVGIFSDNILADCICATGGLIVTTGTELHAFSHFYRLDAPENQDFGFIPEDAPLSAAEAIFQENHRQGRLVSVVYITKSGKATDSILGMLTPWDLLINE